MLRANFVDSSRATVLGASAGLVVYGRNGQRCPRCGSTIQVKRVGEMKPPPVLVRRMQARGDTRIAPTPPMGMDRPMDPHPAAAMYLSTLPWNRHDDERIRTPTRRDRRRVGAPRQTASVSGMHTVYMGLFKHRSSREDPAKWRGRSPDLPDGGTVSQQVMWEAIALPEAAPGSGAMAPLGLAPVGLAPVGLAGVRVGGRGDPINIYHGVRRGHWVQIREAALERGQAMVVWVGVAAPPFVINGASGVLVARDAPDEVVAILARLVRSEVWDGMECVGGPHGIISRRAVSSHESRGWMYDLWLAEALADGTGAKPFAFLPGDPADWPPLAGLERDQRRRRSVRRPGRVGSDGNQAVADALHAHARSPSDRCRAHSTGLGGTARVIQSGVRLTLVPVG